MKLPVLALFERSLRVEARSLLMCLARMALPGVILISLFPVAMMARFGRLGAPGLQFFRSTAWLDFSFITLAGMSYFASAIAEEKEEMTLGLLRMTGLRPLAILLGKSTSRLLGAMLLLLVQFPFTLLAVTLGGIGNLQIVATYGALLAYIFFLSNLALLWSVICPKTKSAASVTGVLLCVFLVAPGALGASLRASAATLRISLSDQPWRLSLRLLQALSDASPVTALSQIFKTGSTVAPWSFQVLSNLAMGAGFFLLAWLAFERCTREQKEQAPGRGFAFRWKGLRGRVPARVRGPRALVWKDFTFVAGGVPGLVARTLFLGLLYAFVACMPAFAHADITRAYVGGSLMVTSLVLFVFGTAIDASRIFRDEIRWKTLSTLVTLPISIRELAYRKALGALCGMSPILGYFVLGVAIYPEGAGHALGEIFSTGSGAMAAVLIPLQFAFFLHLVTYLSLVVKRGALPLAIAIQYFGSTVLMIPLSLLTLASHGSPVVVMFLLGAGSAVLTFILHLQIGSRLVRLAADA